MSAVQQGMFYAKLAELEQRYVDFQLEIKKYSSSTQKDLQNMCEKLEQNLIDMDHSLEDQMKNSPVRLLQKLAAKQLDYCQQVETILQAELTMQADEKQMDDGEIKALFAEYAIDYAGIALKHAAYRMLLAEKQKVL